MSTDVEPLCLKVCIQNALHISLRYYNHYNSYNHQSMSKEENGILKISVKDENQVLHIYTYMAATN